MIWLIGNKGMLGTELSETFAALKIDFVGTDREVSILDEDALPSFAAGKKISWIVNCAAYTAVDKAEDERELAAALNTQGPANIARLAKKISASFLHVSTDYVFDGNGTRPYREDDPVNPTGVYGRTKADGEAAAMKECPRTVIVRTAWLYGKHGPNFVYTMLRLMKERDSIGVVADQRGSPTWARDLSRAISAIVTAKTPTYGIFHFTNGGETVWHEFAQEIQKAAFSIGLLGKKYAVKALTTAEYPTKTRRPPYSVLSKDKIRAAYGVAVPDWKESLSAFIQEESEKKE
jgi:dTDP-4-dehydrorhamnose reductase